MGSSAPVGLSLRLEGHPPSLEGRLLPVRALANASSLLKQHRSSRQALRGPNVVRAETARKGLVASDPMDPIALRLKPSYKKSSH